MTDEQSIGWSDASERDGVCALCENETEVRYVSNPFAYEVKSEIINELLCKHCYGQCCEDI